MFDSTHKAGGKSPKFGARHIVQGKERPAAQLPVEQMMAVAQRALRRMRGQRLGLAQPALPARSRLRRALSALPHSAAGSAGSTLPMARIDSGGDVKTAVQYRREVSADFDCEPMAALSATTRSACTPPAVRAAGAIRALPDCVLARGFTPAKATHDDDARESRKNDF